MVEFLKKNIFIIFLSSITLFLGFLTFLTFIDRSFIELNQNNLQYLLIVNILLLLSLFVFIFLEVKKSIRNDIDPKITLKIWKNMIYAYIDFEKRNFKKK